MPKRVVIVICGAAICLLAVVLMWMVNQRHATSQVDIKFVGLTNNAAGLLGTSDKDLAIFSITNRTGSPVRDVGFYYIESFGVWWTYSPLGSGSEIAPHGCGTILTRIPTNPGAPWRVIVPYSRATLAGQMATWIHNARDSALKRPSFDFERYGKGAPTSDWIKP